MKKFSNKLWEDAKKVIPGGNLLYSKRAEMFLPGFWPSYFTKAKDCFVWDKKNKKYTDMIFAVGTNVLGYSKKIIDNEVKKTIDKGNMTTLNSYEEVLLAKKLLRLNSWASMVKFSRSGGEANAISIRIARAYNKKKQNVAICGYHGWHDWYLSANINNNSNLNSHLSKSVKVGGVNKKLKNTSFSFNYNDLDRLKYLLKNKKIGIIKMEVERSVKPKKLFLKKVRALSNKYKAVLIFDECTSGFRQTLGGIYKDYKVIPDIVNYGKAMGNGYAINAIVGKKKIMQACKDTFISSTFWSERLGFAAAIETIKYMEKNKTYKTVKKIGKYIKFNWDKIAKKNNIKIIISGIDSIPQFYFEHDHNQNKTFLTQEMLKRGFLASNLVYVSIVHTHQILKKYFIELDRVFKKIAKKRNILQGERAYTDFKRLN